jgi:23S rRNA pseudouridine1911/1915/1917 synthase
MRLDLALIERHPDLSRRRARDVIEKGQVAVDGQLALEPGLEVPATAAIAWDPNRKARPRVRSRLSLLYEDEWLLVVDKPAGLLSVPSAPDAREDTALLRVREYAAHLRPRMPYVGLVHRIDRDTSGAVAFALDPRTRQALIGLVSRHAVDRRYLAIVHGEPKVDGGHVDAPIGEEYRQGRRHIARRGEPARPALTHFEVRERFGVASLLALRLETGRQHQIRLHLAHLGHPVLGDEAYGPERAPRLGPQVPRLMLHAFWLGFRHPWTGEPVLARSPLPPDFEGVLRRLRRRAQT